MTAHVASDDDRSLEERLPGYRYGIVLFLLLVTFVFWSAAGTERWVRVVTVALQGATLTAALVASGASRRLVRIVVVVAIGATVAAALVPRHDSSEGTFSILSAVFVALAPLAIVRGIRASGRIDMHTVLGALCVYVLIGMVFAFVFDAIDALGDSPFFAEVSEPTGAEYLYFSFVTLTTTGFGDLTAAGDVGRAVAVIEALFGQLYLVTVVAVLVANIGRGRDRPE